MARVVAVTVRFVKCSCSMALIYLQKLVTGRLHFILWLSTQTKTFVNCSSPQVHIDVYHIFLVKLVGRQNPKFHEKTQERVECNFTLHK